MVGGGGDRGDEAEACHRGGAGLWGDSPILPPFWRSSSRVPLISSPVTSSLLTSRRYCLPSLWSGGRTMEISASVIHLVFTPSQG